MLYAARVALRREIRQFYVQPGPLYPQAGVERSWFQGPPWIPNYALMYKMA